MADAPVKTTFGKYFAQVAWVVNDIKSAESFFRNAIGVGNFLKLENLRAQDSEGTYYGKPADFVIDLYLAYSGETMIELIQPLSGQSIYRDYLDKNPKGGVQHVAYTVPVADLEKSVSELAGKGIPIITTLSLPVAKVVYFDTYKEIGVATEIIGLTEAGEGLIQQLRSGNF